MTFETIKEIKEEIKEAKLKKENFKLDNNKADENIVNLKILELRTKLETLEKIKELIDEMGQSPCGFIDSSDNLCDKIDREELKSKIEGKSKKGWGRSYGY